MYIGTDLPDMSTNDIRTLALDFVNDLAVGETISSSQAFCEVPPELNVGAPTDGNPSSHITNGPTVLGTKVAVRIATLIPGICYRLRIVATTNQANSPELYAHIKCVPVE